MQGTDEAAPYLRNAWRRTRTSMRKAIRVSCHRTMYAQRLCRCSAPAARTAPASAPLAIAQGNRNRVAAKCRRATRRAPCGQRNLQANYQLPRCNANVELRPKEIERAERAHTSSAVCSNNCYTVGQGSGGAAGPVTVVRDSRAPCRARTRQRRTCGMRGEGHAPQCEKQFASPVIARCTRKDSADARLPRRERRRRRHLWR